MRDIFQSIVAGISDNDPTTVATLSLVGAATIYKLTWLVVLLLPMLISIQILSSRIGIVTQKGLVEVIREEYGKYWAWVAMLLAILVNLFTVGADISGGAAALSILIPLPFSISVIILVLGIWLLLLYSSMQRLQTILTYVLLAFLGYIAVLFVIPISWGHVLYHSFVPNFSFTHTDVTNSLALLGTTLTSYMYLWKVIEEKEDKVSIAKIGVRERNTSIGTVATIIIFWAIIVSSGATFGVHHKTIQTAQDAAQVLRPIAGVFASYLFSVGLLGSAILSVAIIMATTGYVFAHAFSLRGSLEDPLQKGRVFYIIIFVSLIIGAGIALWKSQPIQLLFLSSIIGGLGTPVLLVMLLLISNSQKIMGNYRPSKMLLGIGWMSAILVSGASLLYLYYQFHTPLLK